MNNIKIINIKLISILFVMNLFNIQCKLKDGDAQREFSSDSINNPSNLNQQQEEEKKPNLIINAECDSAILVGGTYSCDSSFITENTSNEVEAENTLVWELALDNTCQWLSIDSLTGSVVGVPDKTNAGKCILSYRLKLGELVSNTKKISITITVPPIILKANCNNETMVESSFACQPTIETDSKDLNFTWMLTTLNTCKWIQIDPSTGNLTGSPSTSEVGPCNLSVLVKNTESESNRLDQVINVMAPPIIISEACSTQAEVDKAYSCLPTATTASSDKLFTWQLANDNSCKWAKINTTTGEITGTPLMTEVGNCKISFNAKNSGTVSSNKSINVKVNLKGVNEHLLMSDDGKSGDNFGYSLAILNNTVFVGVPDDDANLTDSGSVNVFNYSNNSWMQKQKIIPNEIVLSNRKFGYSLSADGNHLAIGAPGDMTSKGAVYMYKHDGTQWVPDTGATGKIVENNLEFVDEFGCSVAVSGDTLVVGARNDDDKGTNSGAVYVYKLVSSAWVLQAKLYGSDIATADYFGSQVAISGNIIAVGSPDDDDFGSGAGAIFVFENVAGNWVQTAKIIPPDNQSSNRLGESNLIVSGQRIIFGTPNSNSIGSSSGTVYVYKKNSSSGLWYQEQKLVPPDVGSNHNFGSGVSIYNNDLLIGAPGISKAYRYKLNTIDLVWELDQILFSSTANLTNNQFGQSVGINQYHYLISAPKANGLQNSSGTVNVFTKK